ncbi:Geranylgeranyl pyrophosphate synthase like protein [Verticillium longisporum]|nr:Geranylgeranyl pyrophosphate synthase like protein [Verticillium longisporum]
MSPSSHAGSPPFSGPSILSAALASPNAIPPRTSSTGNGTLGHIPPKSKVSHRPAIASSNLQTTSFTVTMKPPPPPDPNRYATQDLNVTSTRPWPEEKERVVAGPYDYLIAQPGKDFRSQVINAFNAWLDVPHESLVVINKVVGMLHTASLLIDDVEDSSSLRRGLPVAHNIFGVPQTINSANYIYFCALQELQKLNNPDTINIFTEELVNLHRGQGMDLYWRDTLTCPTEDDYLEMVGNKTGGLFRLGIKLMQAESRRHVDCVPLVNVFGLVFQIRDDYMNLNSKEYSNNKGMCEDLTEGQKTSDVEVKRYAVSFMERTGSFEYTRQVIDVLIARARKLVSEIDESGTFGAGIQVILDKMCV